jgi:hypothetical protein
VAGEPDSYVGDVNPTVDGVVKTSLRVYDEAMVQWLQTLAYRGQTATVKAAWEDRAFAQVMDISHKGGPRPKSDQHLPLVSLSLMSIEPDERRWIGTELRQGSAGIAYVGGPDGPKEEAYSAYYPMPLIFNYQVDMWAKTRQDIRFLETSLLEKWGRSPVETYVRVKFDPWYGEKIIPVIWRRIDDTSDIEAGEGPGYRRATVTLEVKGWLFRRPFRRPTLCNAHIAVIDYTADTDQQQQEIIDHYTDPSNYSFSDEGATLDSITELDPDEPRVLTALSWNQGVLTDVGG